MIRVGHQGFDLTAIVAAFYTPASALGPSKLKLVMNARTPTRTQRGQEAVIINTNITLRFSGIEADGIWQKIEDTAEALPTVDAAGG